MSIDRFPKKPCKHCHLMGHFSYTCFTNPKKALKRSPIKKVGKQTKQWLVTRATWIKKNPPTYRGDVLGVLFANQRVVSGKASTRAVNARSCG